MTRDRSLNEECGVLSVAGVRLEFQRLTPPDPAPPTLVLLHEGLGCVALWKEFPRQLARASGCAVLAYSRAGYGGSDPAPLPRPLSFMHDEGLKVLPQLLSAANIERAILLGHSDGASIALINAGGHADPRVEGLILLAPHVFVEQLTLASIRAAQQVYRTTALRERLAAHHGANVDCAFLGWSQAWLDPAFVDWNIEAYLPQIELPVLVLQGEEDSYGTVLQLERIAAHLPRPPATLLLPDCGHAPFREQPARTLAAIISFLRNHLL